MTDAEIEKTFTYHAPTPGEVVQMQNIRESAKALVRTIVQNSPACADRTAAIRKIREAIMTVNAGIILNRSEAAPGG